MITKLNILKKITFMTPLEHFENYNNRNTDPDLI